MRRYRPLQPPVLQNGLQDASYQYREFAPHPLLAPYVACYWTIDAQASGEGRLHRILPDGCIDLILDRRASSFSQGAIAAGLMTGYETIRLLSDYAMFGIRFYSDHARRLFGYPVSAWTGYHVRLDEIWGSEARFLAEEALSAPTVPETIAGVERRLLRMLHRTDAPGDTLFQTGMQYLYASRGTISVRALAEQLGYSEKHLRRTFQQELGMSPKELSGIIRFQSLLGELHRGQPSRLADLAVQYGYYDQSHLNRHFQRYYGLAPTQIFL
ncbi:helix-turn-helix transcriptional regulator [Cohnella nanjingensis]|uniref:Helix-turn-helix transcriptional regulator n=1 Tax=Cohnella nanjingensis TaxID=1387779 RepID=A0A7X0RT77_9BACL|nr:helix-turn-helix transcriptional regulator [Cohnella nanjingensis]MBB6673078.1 helix-turn-helix transcriptional regulator [Cohnella nanjingensis]